MRRLKGMSRRLVVAVVSLGALTAIAVPAALEAHPVQNPILLVSPTNGACVHTPQPTLTWQPRQHATKYKVKLFLDHPNGTETLLYYDWTYGTYNTSMTVPFPLPAGSLFHWGVKGSNDYHGPGGFGDGPWSEVWYFSTCY